jgi:streptogramin lyase
VPCDVLDDETGELIESFYDQCSMEDLSSIEPRPGTLWPTKSGMTRVVSFESRTEAARGFYRVVRVKRETV